MSAPTVSETSGQRRGAANSRWGWRLAATGAVLALLFAVLPREEIVAALGRVSAKVWAIAIFAFLLFHLLGATKWWLLMRSAGARLGYFQVVRCHYFGLFGNIFLPSLVGGDLVRSGLAIRLAPSKTGVILGSVTDRMVDVLGLASIVGIGSLTMSQSLEGQSYRVLVALTTGLGLVGLAGIVLSWALPARRFPMKGRRAMVKIRAALRAMRGNWSSLFWALIMALALQALLVGLCAWLGGFVGVEATLSVWLFVWPLAKLSALVPLTQGGIGVREAAQAVLFLPFGVPAAKAVAAGLVFEAVIITGGLFGGLISVVLSRVLGNRPLPETHSR